MSSSRRREIRRRPDDITASVAPPRGARISYEARAGLISQRLTAVSQPRTTVTEDGLYPVSAYGANRKLGRPEQPRMRLSAQRREHLAQMAGARRELAMVERRLKEITTSLAEGL